MEINYQDLINKIRNGEYKLIGKGSCRYVFDLNDGYVVKVARDIRGLEQNSNEYKIYNNSESGFFAKVTGISDDNRLLVMAKAKKIKRITTVYAYYNVRNPDTLVIINKLHADMENNHISKGDLNRPTSWGFIEGVPKIIDYGLTHSTFKKYYKGNLLFRKSFPPITYW